MIDGKQMSLWLRFPVAAQRLRMALLAATFPRALDATVWIAPAEENVWRVQVRLPASGALFEETFSDAELRAYRGRWDAWTDALAAEVAAGESGAG